MKRHETLDLILDELDRAEKKFPSWPDDFIHASAVINEEAGELTQACLQHVYDGKPAVRMVSEAVQVAAMALRFICYFNMEIIK